MEIFNSENISIFTFTCYSYLLEIREATEGALKHDLSKSGKVEDSKTHQDKLVKELKWERMAHGQLRKRIGKMETEMTSKVST